MNYFAECFYCEGNANLTLFSGGSQDESHSLWTIIEKLNQQQAKTHFWQQVKYNQEKGNTFFFE